MTWLLNHTGIKEKGGDAKVPLKKTVIPKTPAMEEDFRDAAEKIKRRMSLI